MALTKKTLPPSEYLEAETAEGFRIVIWPTHALPLHAYTPDNIRVEATFTAESAEDLIVAIRLAVDEWNALKEPQPEQDILVLRNQICGLVDNAPITLQRAEDEEKNDG